MLDNAVKIIISRPLAKNNPCPKLSGKKILIKNAPHFQFETLRNNKAFHENIALAALHEYFGKKMEEYRQADIWDEDGGHTIAHSSKGTLRFHRAKDKIPPQTAAPHDNEKNYIFKEGDNIPILCELGVFTKDFRVIKGMYSKFRQINNFIEIIDTAVKNADLPDVVRVVDFGCGNSYLTFAVYHYFTQIKKARVHITGIDRQADIIARCTELAVRYNYADLYFRCADIKDYAPETAPDIIISLHGCNTATDYAIYNGIKWGVGFMFVAPCCQQEINAQMKRSDLGELYAPLRYGVLKDRFSSLLTDGLRANMLEIFDYATDMAEFVGFNHSPKNILIKAVKSAHDAKYKQLLMEQTKRLIADFNINPTLCELLSQLPHPSIST